MRAPLKGGWRMANGGSQKEKGGKGLPDGEWRMADGGWRKDFCFSYR